MAKIIKGNHDGINGRNDSYTVRGRGKVSRRTIVRETKEGKHPDHHVVKSGNRDYIRSNPDGSPGNNVD